MSSTVSLSDASVTLGSVGVLDAVSLDVEEGEFLGLVGPNGAGKTTLLRTINGTLPLDSGEVRVSGQAVSERGARAQSRLVATVPQDTSVRFDLRVSDLVAMGRTPYRGRLQFSQTESDRDHVERALERTELTDLRERPIDAISGGERQRAYIARSLAQDTRVLVCDEPTASLDINHQVGVLQLLADLAEEGRTVVAAIHDLTLAARFCDRLALLSDGAIQTVGTPESVLAHETLDAAFETTTTVTTNPVTGTPAVTAHEQQESTTDWRVHVVGGGRVGARVLSELDRAGFTVTAGPLQDGDLATETTRERAIETVETSPTGTPSTETVAAARDLVERADCVVLADVALGSDGWPLDLAEYAGSTVFVEERPLHERNYGDESVARRYDRLAERATRTTVTDVVDAVAKRVELTELPADD